MKNKKKTTSLDNGWVTSSNYASGWSDLTTKFSEFIKKPTANIDPFDTFKKSTKDLEIFGHEVELIDGKDKQKHVKYVSVKFIGDETCSKNKDVFNM
mmetsp:Transcript_122140/g.182446  ORF Transcript_122140/g.182446 Transcript_122140/m.182446 type:complete len:97 (+) Transcript_122140:610-900(+)